MTQKLQPIVKHESREPYVQTMRYLQELQEIVNGNISPDNVSMFVVRRKVNDNISLRLNHGLKRVPQMIGVSNGRVKFTDVLARNSVFCTIVPHLTGTFVTQADREITDRLTVLDSTFLKANDTINIDNQIVTVRGIPDRKTIMLSEKVKVSQFDEVRLATDTLEFILF